MHTFLAPSGAPKNLNETFTDDTTIVIEWEPVDCRHRNGEITGYNVTYYPRTEIYSSVTLFVSEPDHIFIATGLLFEKEYIFEVQAIGQHYGSGSSAIIAQNTRPIQGEWVSYYNTACNYWYIMLKLLD